MTVNISKTTDPEFIKCFKPYYNVLKLASENAFFQIIFSFWMIGRTVSCQY